jgi:iron complex transport system ATP-binding protein
MSRPSSDSILQARAIRVARGGRAILDDVSFAAGAGDFVAVIGPNGAGKSTLLSVLAGLIAPDAGQVTLEGAPLSRIPSRTLASRRAYLPQNPRLEWPLPLSRMVALGLTPHLPAFGGLSAEMNARVGAALEEFDLTGRADQPATTLSGGEFARAMLARATVARPDILIVDEPVTGLDPKHAIESMTRLSAYAASGRLVIASLHDLTLAARYASRIVALKDGRIAGEGGLTSALIRQVFDVEAELRGAGAVVTVDIQGPS